MPFTTVDALQPNQTVTAQSGDAAQGTVFYDAQGNVTGYGPAGPVDAEARVTLDEHTALRAIRLQAGGTVIDLDSADANTDIFATADPRFYAIVGADGASADAVVLSDPLVLGFNHMVFGGWGTGPLAGGAGTEGVGTFGIPTSTAGVPSDGSATYQGALVGSTSSASGAAAALSADVTMSADFGAGNLAFASSSTRDLVTGAARSTHNMTGSLDIHDGTFSGTLQTASGWDGPADGRFFGPAAEEAGGIFDVTGSGLERFAGAFGARR